MVLMALCLLINLMPTLTTSAWGEQSAQEVLIVASKKSRPYTEIIDQVKDKLQPTTKISSIFLKQQPKLNLSKLSQADAIIALGTQAVSKTLASQATSASANTPIAAALITEQAYNKIKQKQLHNNPSAGFSNVSLFPIDQPVERFILLAKHIMPSAQSLGIMLGPNTQAHKEEINLKAHQLFPKVHHSEIGINDNPIHSLSPTIKNSDVFIALPDKQKINLATSKWILQLGQRSRVPVIAFSQKYTQAGALASIYYAPADIAESISNWLTDPKQRSQPFTVSINENVAKALRLKLGDPEVYSKLIEDEERMQ